MSTFEGGTDTTPLRSFAMWKGIKIGGVADRAKKSIAIHCKIVD